MATESQTTEQPLPPSSAFALKPTNSHELATVCCIGVCGLLGNGLVLVVLLHKTYRKKLKNLLIIHQSFVDFIASVVLIVTYSSKSFWKTYSTAGEVWCILIDSELAVHMLANISTVNLLALTWERYLMVVFPVIHRNYISKGTIRVAIGATWVFGSLVCTIYAQMPRVIDNLCMPIWTADPSLIKRISTMLVCFWAPIAIFLVVYPHMLHTLSKRSKVKPAGTDGRERRVMKSNLITVVISVTLAYVTCWGPAFIYYIMVAVDISCWNLLLQRYLGYLGFANCCVNPVLYAFNYNDFRNGVRTLLTLNGQQTASNTPANEP